jgi:MFS family permease
MEVVSKNIRKTSAYLGRNLIPSFGAAFIAAMVTGIVAGVMLRVIMGIIAAAFPELATGLSLSGVLFLLLTGMGFSLAGSIPFTLLEPIFPKKVLFKGLIFGSIHLLLYGIPFYLSNPGDELFGPQAPLAVLLFSMLFLMTGLLLAGLHKHFTYLGRHDVRRRILKIIFFVLILPTIAMLGVMTYEMITEIIPRVEHNLRYRLFI